MIICSLNERILSAAHFLSLPLVSDTAPLRQKTQHVCQENISRTSQKIPRKTGSKMCITVGPYLPL